MEDINENLDNGDTDSPTLARTSTRILRPANCPPSEPTTPTHADSKIKNESFHTCKTTVASPGKVHKRTLRETPQRKAFLNGQTPFRESTSGRKLFNRRKQKSQNSSRNSHNDTFSLGIEQFSFDPDSLEAIRCSSVSTVSTFIMEEQAAAAAGEEGHRLGSPDFTSSISPIRSMESPDKINNVMPTIEIPQTKRYSKRISVRAIATESAKEKSVEVPKEIVEQISKESTPKETTPRKASLENITPKEPISKSETKVQQEVKDIQRELTDDVKKTKEVKSKKISNTFQAPRPVRPTVRTTSRTANLRAAVMRPTNQTVTLKPNIPRRPLSTPSSRRQVEAFKSMAQLEREFERSLRSKEPGNAFSGQFMNQSTRFNMSNRLAASARKL